MLKKTVPIVLQLNDFIQNFIWFTFQSLSLTKKRDRENHRKIMNVREGLVGWILMTKIAKF
jgi:hypothetical protein